MVLGVNASPLMSSLVIKELMNVCSVCTLQLQFLKVNVQTLYTSYGRHYMQKYCPHVAQMILRLFNGDVLSTAEVINRHLPNEELDWMPGWVRKERYPQKQRRLETDEPAETRTFGNTFSWTTWWLRANVSFPLFIPTVFVFAYLFFLYAFLFYLKLVKKESLWLCNNKMQFLLTGCFDFFTFQKARQRKEILYCLLSVKKNNSDILNDE